MRPPNPLSMPRPTVLRPYEHFHSPIRPAQPVPILFRQDRWPCCRCHYENTPDRSHPGYLQRCLSCCHDECNICEDIKSRPPRNAECWTCHECEYHYNIDNKTNDRPYCYRCLQKGNLHYRCSDCHRNGLEPGQVTLHFKITSIQRYPDSEVAYLEVQLRENYETSKARAQGDPYGFNRAKVNGRASGATITSGGRTREVNFSLERRRPAREPSYK